MGPTIELLAVTLENAALLLTLIGWSCLAERWCDRHKGNQ